METWHSRLQGIIDTEGDGAAHTLLWNMLHARVFIDSEGTGYNSLTIHEKTIWVTGIFIGEVINGGFHQFFSNSSGDYSSDDLSSALERLGAKRMLELFWRAVFILSPDGIVPSNRDARNNALDSIFPDEEDCYDAFNKIDKEFYDLPPDAYPDLLNYALINCNEFDFSEQELLKAIEKEPYLLFPGDRLAYARFDLDKNLVILEIEAGNYIIPLHQLQSVSIVKAHRKTGYSGLVYRLASSLGTFDVPYFARGEAHRNLIIWFFVDDVMVSHHLVGFKNALTEAQSPDSMEPIVIWENDSH
jgi:Domain of unknown function (DUF4375)